MAYTLVRGLRTAALEAFNQALAPALPQAGGDAKDFSLAALNPRWDEPVLRLYEEQPAAWRSGLPELLALVDAEIERLQQRHGRLADARWGETENIRVRHPLSAALPDWLGRHIDAPPQPMVGDTLTPRAQARSFGCETVDLTKGPLVDQIAQILGEPLVDGLHLGVLGQVAFGELGAVVGSVAPLAYRCFRNSTRLRPRS